MSPALSTSPARSKPQTARFFIDSLDDGYDALLARGFAHLGETARIRPGDRVAIKPNLTFPTFKPGVMTSPEAVEAVVRHLKNYTSHITVCEADSGGYNKFSMTEVFRATGLDEMAKRYGIKLVNLTHEPSRPLEVKAGWRNLQVPMPALLMEETDLFVTLPVPKVHLNTRNSIAIKNQWGTIQNPEDRLKLHPYFKEVIYAVNRIYPRSLAIVDGRFGLTRSGPLRGDAFPLNWLAMCDNLFVNDMIVTQLQGFAPGEVPYLRWILQQEKLTTATPFEANGEWQKFRSDEFYLKREWTDLPGVVTFHSRLMAWVGYESPLAKPLHWLLYKFREPFY